MQHRTRSTTLTLIKVARFAVEPLEGRLLLSAGDLDPTFGTGGKILLPDHSGSTNYVVNADAVQSDGKILLAGYTTQSTDNTATTFFLERLNTDGSPDATFGAGGVVATAFNASSVANAILLQGDGKIVLGGYQDPAHNSTNPVPQFALARYNVNGSLDSTFGTGGKVVTNLPGRDGVQSLALAPGGTILAGGVGTYHDPAHPTDPAYAAKVFDVARYTANGALDPTFGPAGAGYVMRQAVDNFNTYDTIAIAAQSDGKVLAGSHLAIDMAVWRFNVDGTTDLSFGLDGRTVTPMRYSSAIDNFEWASVSRMVVQPNGQILVAGLLNQGNYRAHWILSRYNPDGTLDTAFGDQGIVISATPDGSAPGGEGLSLGGMALQPDGRIVVGGIDPYINIHTGYFYVRRFLPDGAPDPSFHSYDIAYFPIGQSMESGQVGATVLLPDGRIVIAGNDRNGSESPGIAVFRLQGDNPPAAATPAATPSNPSGTQPGDLDARFGFQGRQLYDDPSPVELPNALTPRAKATAVLASGKILLAGSIGTVANDGKGQFYLRRLNADGTPDTTFGSGGSVATSVGPLSFATSMLVQSDGKIILGGATADSATSPTNYSFALVRYNADGSPDTTFGSAGKEVTDFPGNEEIDSLAFGPNGTIAAAGAYFLYPNVGFDVARYTAAGLPDNTFNGTGTLAVNLGQTGGNSFPAAVAVQADGKVVVGSHAADRFAVYRFNAGGSPDAGFGSGGIASTSGALTSQNYPATSDGAITGAVTKLLVQPNGKILASGQTPDGFHPYALARFNVNGTLDPSFGGAGGLLVPSLNRYAYYVYPLAGLLLQPDGQAVLVGNQVAYLGGDLHPPGTDVLVRKFLPDGSLDPFFDVDQDPQYLPPPPLRGALAEAAAFTPTGSLVVASDVWADRTANSPHWLGVARYVYDAERPVVKSIDRATAQSPATAVATSLTFTVTFSEPVTGVDPADFRVVTDGTAAAAALVVTPTPDAAVYQITVNGVHGSGNLGLNLIDNNTIRDLAGNALDSPTGTFAFQSPRTFEAGEGPHRISVADLNNDARLDVVSWNALDTQFGVLLGNGNGTFAPVTKFSAGVPTGRIVIADWNLDGKPDVVALNDGIQQPIANLLFGNGDGTFQPPQTFAVGAYPQDATAADLNFDGKPDLVLTTSSGISVLVGNGNGTFRSPQTIVAQPPMKDPHLADVNGDGVLDLIVANYFNGSISILLGNGNATFSAPRTIQVQPNPTRLVTADVNGDGRADIAVASLAGNVDVLLGNGNGTFQPFKAVPAVFPTAIAISDLNRDGKPDLLAADFNHGVVEVMKGNGDGTFAIPHEISTANDPHSSPTDIVMTDINGDGRTDLLVANQGSLDMAHGVGVSDSVSVLLGTDANGRGGFVGQSYTVRQVAPRVLSIERGGASPVGGSTATYTVTFSKDVVGLNAADFQVITRGSASANGPVVVAPISGSQYFVTINGVSGVGTLQLNLVDHSAVHDAAGNPLVQTTPILSAVQPIAQPDLTPSAIIAPDLNGDGRADVVTGSSSTRTLNVFMADGAGFGNPQTIVLDSAVLGVAAADVNLDGIPDLVLISYDDTATILLGNGNGSFRTGQVISASNGAQYGNPTSIAVADLTRDGIPDLIITQSGTQQLLVLFGAGDGTFGAPLRLNTTATDSVAAGDVNGDSVADVVVAGGNRVEVFLGLGGGTLAAPHSFAVNTLPHSIALADVNGDGNADVVVAHWGAPTVGLLLGNGDGSFQPLREFTVGINVNGAPATVAVADLNADGKPDLVAGGFDGRISLLLGNGDGEFASPIAYLPGGNAYLVAVADFNADGRIDVAAADPNASRVALLFGTSPVAFAGRAYAVGALPDAQTVTGTGGADEITLTRDPDGSHIDWTMGSNAGRLLTNDPAGLMIHGIGAADTLVFNNVNGNPLPANLHLDGTFTLTGLQGANPLAGTLLDVARSTVRIAYASAAADPIAVVKSYLANGYNAGTWTGAPTPTTGVITSLDARNNPYHNTAIGYADYGDGTNVNPVANTILLKYTIVGDTDLNGTVGLSDYTAVVRNFGTGANWTQGAVTYAATVGLADYTAVVRNFGQSIPAPAAAAVTAEATIASSGTNASAQTPTPTTPDRPRRGARIPLPAGRPRR